MQPPPSVAAFQMHQQMMMNMRHAQMAALQHQMQAQAAVAAMAHATSTHTPDRSEAYGEHHHDDGAYDDEYSDQSDHESR